MLTQTLPTGSLSDFLVPKVINNTVVKIVETHHHYEPGSSSTNASEIGNQSSKIVLNSKTHIIPFLYFAKTSVRSDKYSV